MTRLDTERNNRRIETRVRRGARAAGLVTIRNGRSFFEHGQWWIENADTGAQWSVHDSAGAEGVHTFEGFCFEQVTRGEAE